MKLSKINAYILIVNAEKSYDSLELIVKFGLWSRKSFKFFEFINEHVIDYNLVIFLSFEALNLSDMGFMNFLDVCIHLAHSFLKIQLVLLKVFLALNFMLPNE